MASVWLPWGRFAAGPPLDLRGSPGRAPPAMRGQDARPGAGWLARVVDSKGVWCRATPSPVAAPSPVMQQQSINLNGCTPNAWPA